MSYDIKCYELASAFLEETHTDSPDRRIRLAQCIQDTIEQELCDWDEQDAADAKARDEAAYADHIDRQIDRMRDGDL